MGMYDNQYESYYAKIMKKGKSIDTGKYSVNGHNSNGVKSNMFSKERLVNELIVQLVGTLILFAFVVFCKLYNTNNTKYIYNYGKGVVKESKDIKPILDDIKSMKISDINNKIDDYIDKAKSNILNVKPLKERTKENFEWPIASKEFDSFNKSDDKSILVRGQANEKVFSIGDGTVKENNINKSTNESYVVVDHGSGIESVYIGIVTNKLDKGMKLKKGDEIGKSLGKFKFQLLYMGKEKNPTDYIAIK